MSNNALREYAQVAAPPLWRDIRFLRVFGQAIFVIAAVIMIGWFASNTQEGLRRTGLLPTFEFLDRTSQFQIDEGLVSEPHSAEDTYGHAFLIGTINTLRVIVIGLILTSILGLLMGLARLSTNWLIRQIAVVYIEVMQNTPLLVQLFFLYSGVFLLMPSVREAVQLPGPSYLSIRGFATPALWPTDTTGTWTLAVIISAVIGWLIGRQRSKVQLETGRPMYGTVIGIGIVIIVATIGWVALNPYIVSLPRIVGPRYASGEGSIVSPEFTAIVAGLVLYTSAFVAEIVRSGIQAVPTGQWEAARAQGFSYSQILRLIILPQALRVMIPPLTNQYLNLIKNSSLGAAVGYQDLFSVSKTVFQSGQTIPTIIIVMTIYLVLDLSTSLVMNLLNARFQIKTR